jgi:2-iminobutanoate/2-iminopropanoate deaminase
LSNAVRYANLVFTTAKSGVTPDGRLSRGVEGPTKQALENFLQLLEAAGTNREHLLKTTRFVTSTRSFEKVNGIYSGCFQIPPAPSLVIVRGWGGRSRLIEMEAIAGPR